MHRLVLKSFAGHSSMREFRAWMTTVATAAFLLMHTQTSSATSRFTIQGFVTDLGGTLLPDGTYEAQVDVFMFPEEIARYSGLFFLELTDGAFSQAIGPMDNSVFECIGGAVGCEANLVITILSAPGPVQLPPIPITQSPRAGISERVRGDVETSPSSLTIPASDELAPQTATITDAGMEFIGTNGQPTLKFDNFLGPGHSLPTLEIADPTLTTIGGPTTINHSFTVNVGQDATPDFTVNNIDGVRSQEQIISFQPTATSRFEMQFDGDIFMNSHYSGVQDLADLELLNGGGATMRSTSVAFDRNNDNLPDVHFQSNGNCTFNCDLTGGADATFGTSSFTFAKPLLIDPAATGTPYYRFESSQCSFNPGGGTNPEVAIEGGTATFSCGTVFDLTPAVFGENAAIGNNIAFFDPNADGKREVSTTGGNLDFSGAVSWDVDQDGTDEATFTAPGGNFTADIDGDVDITGDFTAIGTLSSGAGTDITGVCQWDVDGDATDDVTLTTPGGIVTFTLDGNFDCSGIKNFVQQHPSDPHKEIVYTALEAGESGTYTRGSGTLTDGVAVIELPEHFALVTNADGLTAQITPRGPVQSMLYVEAVTPTQLIVRASNTADAETPFDYLVNGVRNGFENHQAIRTKREFSSR